MRGGHTHRARRLGRGGRHHPRPEEPYICKAGLIEDVFRTLNRWFGTEFRPKAALDFGCGVGRLAIPLAERCERVVGVDVSPSMLKEARANIDRMKVGNLSVCPSIAEARKLAKFDMVNSYIVFQHIPLDRGYALFQELVDLLEPGGVGALHVTFAVPAPWHLAASRWLRRRFAPLNWVANRLKGRPAREPFMQMNGYDLNRVFSLIQSRGGREIHLTLTHHQGPVGATIFFQKAGKPSEG